MDGLQSHSHNCQGKSQSDVPTWLNDIKDNSLTDADEERADRQPHADNEDPIGTNSRRSSLLNFGECLSSYDVPESSESLILSRPSSSARFGRRAQHASNLTKQFTALTTPKNVSVSSSDYIVPKLDNYDFHSALSQKAGGMSNSVDDKLEKSWRSLSIFQQSHKGRLDSAKNHHVMDRKRLGDHFDLTLSPISPTNSTNSPIESPYSPSMLDPEMPNTRSRSEMSSYMPQYVYSKIRKATEAPSPNNVLSKTITNYNSITKSRSTENLFMAYSYKTKDIREMKDFHGSEESLSSSKLNEYKLNVARENDLRQQIINELLLENENISKKTTAPKTLEDDSDDSDEVFIIPELPMGKLLRIFILTTWGDKYYVGLNGIELFGEDGMIIAVKEISASPSDVNVLAECANDPRVVTNLLDGVNRTQDDVHLWLAPYTRGGEHVITIEFEETSVISMIRFWNYNKSRIHSHRGARDVIMELDETRIFVGEIAKACGGIIGGVDAFGDTILFTVNDDILEKISQHDHAYPTLTTEKIHSPSSHDERPLTSSLTSSHGSRPRTGNSPSSDDPEELDGRLLHGCRKLEIVLISNWGFANVIGLTAIQIIEYGNFLVPIMMHYIACNPALQQTLYDGENVTTDPDHMWLTPYKYGEHVKITLEFDRIIHIGGIRIWNYNENLEMTYAGVSRIKIFLDEHPVSNPLTNDTVFQIRRAPGNTNYNFVQEILLGEAYLENKVSLTPDFIICNNLINMQDCPVMPDGYVFEIIIYSTWGDPYYCGLNGLEIYDHKGRKLYLEESNICAFPESVNVLPHPEDEEDIRTPDKLIDNVNESNDGSHAWLAPIFPKCLNHIYVVLDQPVCVSVIKFWNYSKTSSRGVKEFAILLDDLLIYTGVMDRYSFRDKLKYRTVVFSDDLKIVGNNTKSSIEYVPPPVSPESQPVGNIPKHLKCPFGIFTIGFLCIIWLIIN